jgi:hypothetical protein
MKIPYCSKYWIVNVEEDKMSADRKEDGYCNIPNTSNEEEEESSPISREILFLINFSPVIRSLD